MGVFAAFPRRVWGVLLCLAAVPCWADTARVDDGLLSLYTFDEPTGNVVHQDSREDPLDLLLEGEGAARWLRGELQVESGGFVRSGEPPRSLYSAIDKSQEFTVELWITPEHLRQQGPARIFSLSADAGRRNLTIGQDKDVIDVRLRTTKTDSNGLPSVRTPDGSLKLEPTHLVVARNSQGGLRIYLNGQPVVSETRDGDLSNWDHDFPLLLGNEATRDRPWEGRLRLLALYRRALEDAEVQRNHEAGPNVRSGLLQRLPPPVDRAVDFVADVQPILRQYCYECHVAGNEEGGLNLALRDRAIEGGASGSAFEPGNSLHSRLIHLVSGLEEARVMPPDGDRLTDEQIGILRAWIDQGARWPREADVLDPRLERAREHWAFRRLSPIEPPQVAGDGWARTPVDAFIERQWNEHGLSSAPPLAPTTLARRLYFDLIGLPPTPEQVAEFVARYENQGPSAVDELVDQLLSSRHYGERWARHWLDAARFAESDGQESDRDRPHAYRYRDFVIRALNADMPMDQFVRWQIAGDEYEPENPEAVVATGFLTAGTHSVLGEEFLEEEKLFNRYNELDDVISTLGSAMLGLTVGCARCHDHKYDALSAREYYRLLSVFHSGDRHQGKLPNGEEGLYFRDFDARVRTTWLFRRADFYDRELEVRIGFPAMLLDGRDAEHYWEEARAARPDAPSTLQRRALAEWLADVDHGAGPLVARVMVNRVWMHHFGRGLVRTEGDFGVRGDPPTHPELLEFLANDFVRNGWQLKRLHRMILGSAVWQQGGSGGGNLDGTEPVSADSSVDPQEVDPDNLLWWNMPPRRLEAEILRDSMLAVSGTLNRESFGPSFKPYIPPEANLARNLQGDKYPVDAPDNAETRRRSIYMFHKRLLPYPLLQAFDRPDLLVSCSRRQDTTVAPQALAMMNDRFIRTCAGNFADRLQDHCGADVPSIVVQSFQWALSRQPTDTEQLEASRFIQARAEARGARGEEDAFSEALTDYCQTLFCLNEFVYVD